MAQAVLYATDREERPHQPGTLMVAFKCFCGQIIDKSPAFVLHNNVRQCIKCGADCTYSHVPDSGGWVSTINVSPLLPDDYEELGTEVAGPIVLNGGGAWVPSMPDL